VVNNQRAINALFAALADPTRRRILMRLREGELTVSALASPFRISLPAISRHLRILEQARLIRRRRRGRLHLIRARRAGLEQVQRWLTHLAAGWRFSFDALDKLLEEDQEKGGDHDRGSNKDQ